MAVAWAIYKGCAMADRLQGFRECSMDELLEMVTRTVLDVEGGDPDSPSADPDLWPGMAFRVDDDLVRVMDGHEAEVANRLLQAWRSGCTVCLHGDAATLGVLYEQIETVNIHEEYLSLCKAHGDDKDFDPGAAWARLVLMDFLHD